MTKEQIIRKVPAITLSFWVIKILCTTLGETGGDAVSMTWNLGYLVSSFIFLSVLVVLIFFQTKAKEYNPWLYWSTIIASTTAGTTMADFADRSLGIGYPGGSLLLVSLLLLTFYIWKKSTGTISIKSVTNEKAEIFYWIAITFSQTLGTALGDWMADTNGFGYLNSSYIFGAILLLITFLYHKTKISKVMLFWAAFILTRPLGAVVGDLLDKPITKGGFDISRPLISLILLIAVIVLIAILPLKISRFTKKSA
jgi:uncharacterized membrane-anchored protein